MNEIERAEVDFTQVGNKALRDKNLSLKAKGMYAYLYSKPKTWRFSGHRMGQEMADKRDGVYRAMKELKDNGYLKTKKLWNGRIKYFLDIDPDTVIPDEATKPDTEKPKYGKTLSGKSRTISNTYLNTNTYKESNIKNKVDILRMGKKELVRILTSK